MIYQANLKSKVNERNNHNNKMQPVKQVPMTPQQIQIQAFRRVERERTREKALKDFDPMEMKDKDGDVIMRDVDASYIIYQS